MKRTTVYFTAPRQVELREDILPALGADNVLVQTICSAISAGTEMLVYRGEFPRLVDSHDSFSSDLNYPTPYGYACVGVIRETGKNVDKSLRDKMVFGFEPHTSAFICSPSSLIFAPASFPAETCSFLPNMETAVNLIQDAAPILGERVLVLGQGVVGLLVASLLKEFPIESLVTSDFFDLRRKASLALGVHESFDPEITNKTTQTNSTTHIDSQDSISKQSANQITDEAELDKTSNSQQKPQLAYAQKFDLTFELSGSPSALNDAIALTTFTGRIIVGSWYGEKKVPIDLGGIFHRSRIKMISSQVSTIAPELSTRWDKARRFGVAWEALKRIQPQKWITHRFSIEEAEQAYRLLDENPQETLQVLFTYDQG